MQTTNIEWATHTINPVKGLCPRACSYCYARRMYQRFKWDPTVRYEDSVWHTTPPPPGSRVFVGSTMELFGPWIHSAWIRCILDQVQVMPYATLIFLTKHPERLAEFNPWPKNAWVGASATNDRMFHDAYTYLADAQAPVRFISFEPLLDWVSVERGDDQQYLTCIDWVIIGAQTQPAILPEREWVEGIEQGADELGVPVFEKASLASLFPERTLRREWPAPQNGISPYHGSG